MWHKAALLSSVIRVQQKMFCKQIYFWYTCHQDDFQNTLVYISVSKYQLLFNCFLRIQFLNSDIPSTLLLSLLCVMDCFWQKVWGQIISCLGLIILLECNLCMVHRMVYSIYIWYIVHRLYGIYNGIYMVYGTQTSLRNSLLLSERGRVE